MFKKIAIAVLFVMTLSITFAEPIVTDSTSKSTPDSTSNSTTPLTCVRWRWSNYDTFNRTSVCLEWKTKDCSHRLYKELCKGGF